MNTKAFDNRQREMDNSKKKKNPKQKQSKDPLPVESFTNK